MKNQKNPTATNSGASQLILESLDLVESLARSSMNPGEKRSAPPS